MIDKGKRERRHQEEDTAFNRMLLWLAGTVAVELLILLIKKIYVDFIAGFTLFSVVYHFFRIFSYLGAVLTAAGIVWAVLNHRRKKSATAPCICAAAAAGLWLLSAMGFFLFPEGMDVMLLLPAVAAVLIVVYFLYQRVFFLNALMSAGGLLVLWMYRQYYMERSNMVWLFFAAEFILLAAGLVMSLLLRRNDGKLGGLQVMPPDTDYVMTWITFWVAALAMVLTLALGTAVGLYLLFGLVAWVFIQAVFYTVQLM